MYHVAGRDARPFRGRRGAPPGARRGTEEQHERWAAEERALADSKKFLGKLQAENAHAEEDELETLGSCRASF